MYDYHFFYGLEKRYVAQEFPEWKPDFVEKAYNHWSQHFNRMATIFYRSQYDAHAELVEKRFCREYNCSNPEQFESFENRDLWHSYCNQQGLTEHRQHLEDKMSLNELYHDAIGYGSMNDALDNYMERLMSTEIHPHDTIVEMLIMQLWFNSEFNNSPEIAHELRNMPYDDYLKTDHWRRIRAAMMIAHGARVVTSQPRTAATFA